MKSQLFKSQTLVLVGLVAIGAYLRFTKLDWGEGWFFHPDERNIAGSVSQLNFPTQMNPHFYSYGTFPTYTYYFLTLLFSKTGKFGGDLFTRSILIGRGLSATASLLSIYLVWLIGSWLMIDGRKLKPDDEDGSLKTEVGRLSSVFEPQHLTSNLKHRYLNTVGLIAATLTIFTVGLVQYAHFSTVESLLGFQYLLMFYWLVRFTGSRRLGWIAGAAVIFGFSSATKITSVLFLPVVFAGLWFGFRTRFLRNLVLFLIIGAVSFLAMFPYSILDWKGFRDGMRYESGVATGKIDVFYTKQYQGSLPVLWHFDKVLPWSLGTGATALLPVAWGWVGIRLIFINWRDKKFEDGILKTDIEDREALPYVQHRFSNFGSLTSNFYSRSSALFLIWLWVTIFFGWHTFLYVKWIRYLVPILPFMNLLLAWFLAKGLIGKGEFSRFIYSLLLSTLLATSIYQSFRLFRIYKSEDTRITTRNWAEKNVRPGERILSEIYDLGVIAMPEDTMATTKLFNFYDLDADNQEKRVEELARGLEETEWILVPSRRIYGNALNFPGKSRRAGNYYRALFSGMLGFEKRFESGVDTFFDGRAEETYEVFDHPTLILFRKTTPLGKDIYRRMIQGQ